MSKLCHLCGTPILPPERAQLGYTSCLSCGDSQAKQVKHCIAPMHKSNYMVFTNKDDLKGINNKGGFHNGD